MKVLIITGGSTSERKISLISANNVKGALEEKGHKVKLLDFKKGVSNLKEIARDIDVIFPILHGKEGEDDTHYSFLKKLGKPFVGSNPKSSETAFDKKILNLDDNFLIEEYVNGIEITVAVFNNQALPVIEIIPPSSGWFDYKNKYSGESKEIVGAPSLDEKTKKTAQKIALKIHGLLNLNPYSRVDMIVSNNIPLVLEVNPQNGVGMTSVSLMPKAAKAVGIDFPQLLDKIINLALKDLKL